METRFNNPIFVCGESPSTDGEPHTLSTKAVLLANLASNWAVRTHHEADGADPRAADKETLFRNIASSSVFLFVFSEETSVNAFYLNQLGIAFARGVHVVGIREPSYILPNPLPELFYSTEVVDLTAEARRSDGGGRGRPSATTRGKATLANLLVELFRGAVVYASDFHQPCLERLFRKVTDAFARSEKERCFPAPGSTVPEHGRTTGKGAEAVAQKVWTSVGGLAKCPKCGSPVKAQRKTSVLRKTNSVDNLVKKEATSRAASCQQRRDAPQLMITKSVLQPVLQSSFSKAVFQPGPRRPATSVVRQTASSKSAGSGETRVEPRDDRGWRATSSKSCNTTPDSSPPLKEVKRAEVTRDDDGWGVVKETSNAKENEGTFVRRKTSSTTSFITNRRGAFLRKMSSLPCIPTTYLVTDPASDAPALVRYPPVSGHRLSDDANVPEFTDDEDKETIHISRRPSPAISTCSTNIE